MRRAAAVAVVLSLAACQPSWEVADKDAAQCAMQAQRLYPHDTNLSDNSALSPGLPFTYELNCMKARGYQLNLANAACNLNADKQALFTGSCYVAY